MNKIDYSGSPVTEELTTSVALNEPQSASNIKQQ